MQPPYVIITPANNEEKYIKNTLESVIAQTVKPSKWIIVDDGSVDRTSQIVRDYLPAHDFLQLLHVDRSSGRSFSRKVDAFNAGLRLLNNVKYSYIGNLDADVSFAPEYFEHILAEFHKDPKLGIAGGIVYTTVGQAFVTTDTNLGSVGGAVQLFRRNCFEQIGGYLPLSHGGIDAAAEILARMKGWKVRKFPDNKVWEYRRTGSVGHGTLTSMCRLGVRFHTLGWSTGFFILRSISKVRCGPSLFGSAAMLLGFLWARLTRCPLSLPPEAVSYLRSEQARKLRGWFLGQAQREVDS